MRASVAAPLPVATAELGRLTAVAPGAVARALFLILVGSTPARAKFWAWAFCHCRRCPGVLPAGAGTRYAGKVE